MALGPFKVRYPTGEPLARYVVQGPTQTAAIIPPGPDAEKLRALFDLLPQLLLFAELTANGVKGGPTVQQNARDVLDELTS